MTLDEIEWAIENIIKKRGNHHLIYDAETERDLSAKECEGYIARLRKQGKVAIAPGCPCPRPDGTCPTHEVV